MYGGLEDMKRIEDIKTMDHQGPGGHVRFGRVRRKHGFGLATSVC